MQLGTRWTLGDEPPARLPEAVIAAIREVESATPLGVTRAIEAAGYPRRWTLTWLEGRPRVELDPADDSDAVTIVEVHPYDGTVRTSTGDSDEEWAEH